MLNATTIIDDIQIQNLLAQERITERDAYDYINGDEKAVLWYYWQNAQIDENLTRHSDQRSREYISVIVHCVLYERN